MRKLLTLLIAIVFSSVTWGQTIFTQNFESVWTLPTTLTPAWSGTTTPADNVWHQNAYTTGWASTTGAYTPTGANATTASARFHTYDVASGGTGDFITPTIDFSANVGIKIVDFYYINTTGTDVVNVYLSTDNGVTWGSTLKTVTTAAAWTKYSVILGSSASTQCKVKFTATSDWGTTDLGIDEVVVRIGIAGDAAPTTFTATAVTQTGMTLGWTDNSTNETSFRAYRSTDNISFVLAGADVTSTTTAGIGTTYSLVQTGLVPGATYYYRIASVVELESAYLTGSQATNAAGVITSIASGNWSAPATWSTGIVPTATDNVIIADGHTVNIDITTPTCLDLTVGQGVSGILTFTSATASTLIVNGSITVAAGANFNAGTTVTIIHNIYLGGNTANSPYFSNLTVNGSFDMWATATTGRATLTFFGNQNSVISGTGTTLDFNNTNIINKGTVIATSTVTPILLDLQRAYTVQGASTLGFLTTHTAGTLKISGSFTQANPIYTTASYTVPATAGIWLNNANFTVTALTGSPTVTGLFKVTSGIYNIGTAAGNSMGSGTGGVFIIEGGAINVSGRFNLTSTGVYYNQSGGTLSVVTVANTTVASAGFGITSGTSFFVMSGGTIVLVQRNSGILGLTTRDYYVVATPTITGGTLQVGSAATLTNFNFRLYGYAPNVVIDNTTNNKKAEVYQTTGVLYVFGTLTVNTGTTFDCLGMSGFALGNVVNNGIIQGLVTGSRFDFSGTVPQTYTGTGTFGTALAPFIGTGVGIANTANVTLSSPIITTRVNLFAGTFINSNQITLGNGGASSAFVQRGGGATNPAGTFDVAPIFAYGTGGIGISYFTASNMTSSGFEIPASRIISNVTINNSFGVTLLGGALSTAAMTMTLGNITTTAANLLTVTGTATTAITYTAGYVNGPLARILPASLITGSTYNMPVGKGTYNPFALVNPTTNAGGTVTVQAEVFDANCGGTSGILMGALNSNRYWAASLTSGNANFTNSLIQLNDLPLGADAIAASATVAGAYDIVGGVTITATASSLTSTAPAAASLPGFFVMGNKAAATLTNLAITPSGNQCTNVARTVTVTATPGGGAVTNVVINYSINSVAQTAITMTNIPATNNWTGTIPTVVPVNANITWSVTATDANLLTKTAIGTPYTDEPALGVTAVATASLTSVCSGSPTILNVAVAKTGNVAIGTALTLTSATAQPTAFCNRWASYRMQTVYTAAELNAAGLFAGPISAIAYNITTLGDAATNANFTVKVGTTALSAFTDFISSTGFTTVFPAATYTHAVGVNTITFTTPYNWDGTSNLVIEVSHDGADLTNNSITYYTATVGNTVAHSYNGTLVGTPSTNRLNIVFTGNTAPSPSAYSWSDGSIVVGTTNPLTVNPTANKTYTATATISGCPIVSNNVAVTVNALPATPTANNSSQCGAAVPNCSVTSTSGAGSPTFNWYTAPTGGTPITGNTANYGDVAITVATHFYVSEFNGTCESPRIDVFANVGAAPAITITADQTVCNNSVASMTVTSTLSDFNSYQWSPVTDLYTDAACTVPYVALANATTVYSKSAIGGSAVYTCNSLNTTTFCTNIATSTVTTLPATSQAIAVTGNNFCMNGSSVLTASPTIGYGSATFQWQNSSNNITFADIASATSTTYTTPLLSNTTYYKILVKVGATTCSSSNVDSVVVNNPLILSSTPATRCGTGSVALGVTGSTGSTVNWYAALTGGVSLATGTSFNTPSISATTTYYAEASAGSQTFNTGIVSDIPANLSSLSGYGVYFTSALNAVINSVDIYPSTAGTLIITMRDGASAIVDTRTFTIAAGEISNTVKKTLALGFNVPAGATGWSLNYDIAIYRGGGSYVYSTVVNGFSITGNTINGNNIVSGTRYYFYNWSFSNPCSGSRVPVTATVNTPPAITVSSTPAAICLGQSTTLDVSSANTGYTYSWAPTTVPATGASVSASPLVSTAYNITATDISGGANDGCVATATVNVTVNPIPEGVVATSSQTAICSGLTINLTSVPSGGNVTLIDEKFNGATNTFVAVNTSTGGTPALANWTLEPDAYVYGGETFHSNDNTQFYITNSDAQGNGGTTATTLETPTFSTLGMTSCSLNFYQYFYSYTGSTAYVEVYNGTTWIAVGTYTTTQGTSAAFINTVISLDSYVGLSNVKVRFRYVGAWAYYWAIDNVLITGVNPAFTYAWTSVPAGFTSTSQNPTGLTPTTSTQYNLVVSTPAGCTNTANTSVTVTPLPTIALTSSNAVTICQGGNTDISIALTGTGPWTWVGNDGSGPASFNETSSPVTLNVAPTVNTTYSIISVTDATGCSNTSTGAVAVTVHDLPIITVTTSTNPTICGASDGTATASAGTTYLWNTTPSQSTQQATGLAAGTYTVTVSDGTCENTATVSLNDPGAPTVGVLADDNSVCPGTLVTFTANGATAYEFFVNGTSQGAPSASSTFTSSSLSNGDVVSVDGTTTGCTGSSNSIDITVFTVSTVTISDVAGVYTSTATTGNQWYDANGILASEIGATYTPTVNGDYHVVATDANGCTTTSNTLSFVLSSSNNGLSSSLNIYPNPAKDKVFVEVSNSNNSRMSIELMSLDGRVLYENSSEVSGKLTISINLNEYASGIYMIKAVSENNSLVQKLVIQ